MEQIPLRPHELAAQLMQTDYEIRNGRVESLRLNELITRSQHVWRQLIKGQFEQTEHGHATIGIQDSVSDYQTDSGNHVDGLTVDYHDRIGNRTKLGGIGRIDGPYSDRATAFVGTGEGKHAALLPDDTRWDAIVGTIGRAIAACYRGEAGDQ